MAADKNKKEEVVTYNINKIEKYEALINKNNVKEHEKNLSDTNKKKGERIGNHRA